MLDLEDFELSDVGRVRDHNEDYVGTFVPLSEDERRAQGWLYVLADGVGGQAKGEVAAETAVQTVIEGFRASSNGESHTALMPRLVQAANARIYELGRAATPGGYRMATTIVACAFRFDRMVVSHVGDSRCYIVRGGVATQVTRDHTVVAEQIRLGILSAREAREARTRHLLSRSLGADMFVNVDTGEHQLLQGDVVLLCSDGLHGAVQAPEMADTVTRSLELEAAARGLIAMANERDGSDNATVQLIRVLAIERMGMYRGRPYKLR